MGWLVCTATREGYEKLGVASTHVVSVCTFVLQKDSRCFLTTSRSGEGGYSGSARAGPGGGGQTRYVASVVCLISRRGFPVKTRGLFCCWVDEVVGCGIDFRGCHSLCRNGTNEQKPVRGRRGAAHSCALAFFGGGGGTVVTQHVSFRVYLLYVCSCVCVCSARGSRITQQE